jgi:hypothetical protein
MKRLNQAPTDVVKEHVMHVILVSYFNDGAASLSRQENTLSHSRTGDPISH